MTTKKSPTGRGKKLSRKPVPAVKALLSTAVLYPSNPIIHFYPNGPIMGQ